MDGLSITLDKSRGPRQITDIPYSRWYLAMACLDYRQLPDDKIAAALCPQAESDRQELGVWFKALLDQIYSEVR